jgi:DNA repair protein RadC
MTTTFEQIAFIPQEQKQEERAQALRLRERLLSERGFDSFDDTEILSTVLSYASGTKNTAGLVGKLLDTFGSLKAILEARPEQLLRVEGMNQTRATLISMMIPMARVWQRCANEIPDRIGNSREAEKYCLSILAGHRTERFYVISLNAKCAVLGRRKISDGSLSEVSAYPRMVMETALNYNAHSVLLCHNHPGGTCAPSPEDISSTIQLQRLLNGVGILVLDHIIVAGDRTYSMIQHGDIDYRMRGSRR